MLKCYFAEIALVEDPQVFELWMQKVNIQRREKVLRCKNEKDRQRSLMAGILLRYALENEGISYENAVFSKTKEGKPFLESNELYFSLSHAGDYAVCVISDDTPVGIDIECLDRSVFQDEKKHRLHFLAKKCLSQSEWGRFELSEENPKLFLEYWTKKEAYSKAVGKGLGMEFSGIDTERYKEQYWTLWKKDKYCISIYQNTNSYADLVMEELFGDYEKWNQKIEQAGKKYV